ncbi:MAG: hypothetical protein ACXVHX_02215 [Solirubrobacteraceae bacterium]
MNIPVDLPRVRVTVTHDGHLQVEIDREPYAAHRRLARSDLPGLIDEITEKLDSPVRIEITENDGATYVDLATPPHTSREPEEPIPAPGPRIHGRGFAPGETVAIAYVVMHRVADADGTTTLQLPPALLARRDLSLVLYGLDSRVTIEATG